MRTFLITLLVIVLIAGAIVGVVAWVNATRNQADKVSVNISKEADNFNVTRRLAVINTRSDKPMFELIGNFSLGNNSHNELEIVAEVSKGVYKKHFVYLNGWTSYVVEDVSGSTVNSFVYEVNFLPEAFSLFTFTSND